MTNEDELAKFKPNDEKDEDDEIDADESVNNWIKVTSINSFLNIIILESYF